MLSLLCEKVRVEKEVARLAHEGLQFRVVVDFAQPGHAGQELDARASISVEIRSGPAEHHHATVVVRAATRAKLSTEQAHDSAEHCAAAVAALLALTHPARARTLQMSNLARGRRALRSSPWSQCFCIGIPGREDVLVSTTNIDQHVWCRCA